MVLAGFAMGTGEVARYLAAHGPGRVKAAVLVAPLLPFLLKTNDNPDGIDRSVFDRLAARIAADRQAAMKDFMDRSYNIDLLGGSRVSDQAWQNSFYAAVSASAHAALRCVTACLEDFRADLATISIPVLVIHGDQDRVLPYEATGSRLPALLSNAAPSSSRAGRTRLSGPTPTRSTRYCSTSSGTRAGLAHGTADRGCRRSPAEAGRRFPGTCHHRPFGLKNFCRTVGGFSCR